VSLMPFVLFKVLGIGKRVVGCVLIKSGKCPRSSITKE